MSAILDGYTEAPTSLFEGKVKNVEDYETVKGDRYALVWVRGVNKPLAIPRETDQKCIPSHGEHVSATNVVEGNRWYFLGHRSIVTIKPEDFEVWREPSKVDVDRMQQAENIVLEYARKHSSVCADDVCDEIWSIFPDRDTRIVGAVFLSLSKKGLIHKFGYKPTERRNQHASPIPIWHLADKAKRKGVK